jgi:hypothetical protein
LVLVGVWVFAALALGSFDTADWPSHAVAVHNVPSANLGGVIGALFAYWSYHLIGLASWLILLALGTWLVLEFMRRSPSHPALRMAGVLIAAASLSTLHALVLPTSLGLAGAPGGVIGHAVAASLAPAMGTLGSVMIVLVLLIAGLVVAAD